MNAATLRDRDIVQEIAIHAPAERIFRALTDPAQLLQWWKAPGKFELVRAACDLRPGGKWRMELAGACGNVGSAHGAINSVVHGEYREIVPPRLLVFTWIREFEDDPETLVRWDLEESGGVTTVRVTHSGLDTEALRARNGGWPLIVSLLQAHIAEPAHA